MAVIKRKPDTARIDGTNQTKSTSINECIDFTIQNVGTERFFFGFSKDSPPDIPVEPGQQSPWPLYRPCEEWDGEIYIKFGPVGSVALVLKTI